VLKRLLALLRKGLEQTKELWPAVRVAFGWVHQAARILKNTEELSEHKVRLRLRGLLGAMARHRAKAGSLASTITHFLKVTRSYWPGIFHCYRIPDLPRTNNDLEHLFGSSRYHERRATGRKVASPALVLRGSVRLMAATATRLRIRSGEELQPHDLAQWCELRKQLEARQQVRRCGLRFRRDPQAYLQDLELRLLKLALPS
jgi:hypothetical protein